MSQVYRYGVLASAMVIALGGCSSSEKKEQPIVPDKAFEAPVEHRAFTKSHDGVYLGAVAVEKKDEPSWMDGKTVTLEMAEPVSAGEVIKSLRAQGINITANMPVQGLSYSGYGVTDMPLSQALKIIFYSMGLDFINHEEGEYITITPAKPKTWYVDIGNRKVDFRSEGVAGAAGGDMGATTSSTNNSVGQAQPGEASFESQDDFWTSIEEEIEARLDVIVDPLGLGKAKLVKVDEGADVKEVDLTETQATQNGQSGNSEVVLGTYAINPDTNAVTVRAPAFVLDELDAYFERLDQVYNTQLKFEGQLLSVSQNEESSRGIDLAAFATFADGYGFTVRNNSLGGVTVSPPSDGDIGRAVSVAAENALGGAMLGLTSPDGALQLFNAFLESQGDVRTLQKPSVTTKSGIPGSFAKKETTYYNSVSQTTAGGDLGSGAVGVQNELVPVEMGVSMQIYPKFNPDKNNVSAQLNLSQIVLSDVLKQKQYLNTGGSSGGVETVEQDVPVLSDISYSGELILSDGDLVIVGGQMEYEQTNNGSGIMGRRDAGLFKYLMGQDTESKRASTTYFAITVDIDRK